MSHARILGLLAEAEALARSSGGSGNDVARFEGGVASARAALGSLPDRPEELAAPVTSPVKASRKRAKE